MCYNSASGVLAQLARASAWHAEGQEFESPTLHQFCIGNNLFLFLCYNISYEDDINWY